MAEVRAPVAGIFLEEGGAPGAEGADKGARCRASLPEGGAEMEELPAHAPTAHCLRQPPWAVVLRLHAQQHLLKICKLCVCIEVLETEDRRG